ncbi:MAG: type I-B CRISPR-associated endonuclease Cas1b [Brevinematales bacterium]
MKKPIYIFSDGELKRKDKTLYFEKESGKNYIPIENTSEIMIFGEVTLNKRLLEFLTQNEVIIHFFNHYGYYIGTYYPREHLNSGFVILKQAEHYLNSEKRTNLAKKIVYGAVENIKKVLGYYNSRGKDLSRCIQEIDELQAKLDEQSDIEQLMAIEGNIREQYYKAFDIIIEDEDFCFESRTKRPPQNRLNTLISFGNSMLYTTCLSEIYKTHLDPRIGFLHTTNFRRFSLNLDVAEIFKPIIVDRVIFSLLNKGMIKEDNFENKMNGIVMNKKGMEIFVKEYDERLKTTIHHKGLGRNVSYKKLIRLELYKIEKHIMGDEEYKPFVSGW